jgi:uncharacterized membrane protein (DUF4010 family)
VPALVLLVVKLTERYAPVEGMYVVATVAGLTDADAITLSMAEFACQSSDLIQLPPRSQSRRSATRW